MDEFGYDGLAQRVVFGAGAAVQRLGGEIDRLGGRRVLLVASRRDAERVAGLVAPFADRVVAEFTAVQDNPVPVDAAALRALVRAVWEGPTR